MGPKSNKTHTIVSGPRLADFTVQSREELAVSGLLNTSAPPVTPATPVPTAPTMTTQAPVDIPMDTTVQDATMEDLINRLINTSMTDSTTSKGIPDIVFQIKCNQEAHKVPEDVTKGYFVIQGRDFIRKSMLQVNEISEMRIKAVGCGHAGCESTMEDTLCELSGPILCYKCRSTNTSVEMTQGCETHEDTKLTTLVFSALSMVAN